MSIYFLMPNLQDLAIGLRNNTVPDIKDWKWRNPFKNGQYSNIFLSDF